MKRCKKCKSEIKWKKIDGRWHCFNPDGTDHWDLCSKLRFERIKTTGEHFKTGDAEGYMTGLKRSGVQYTHLKAISRTKGIGPSGLCKECTLPWEEPCKECPDKLISL